jgi:hypothetical protein
MIKKTIRPQIIHERPDIIMIPPISPTSSSNTYHECSLKENIFDPSKSSPPNEFLLKLQLRMDTYSKSFNFNNVDMRNSE